MSRELSGRTVWISIVIIILVTVFVWTWAGSTMLRSTGHIRRLPPHGVTR